jgi:hypothetical protein
MQPKSRLDLNLPQAVRERITKLQDHTGAESMTEVIRRALSVYDALVSATADGDEIIVRSRYGRESKLILT